MNFGPPCHACFFDCEPEQSRSTGIAGRSVAAVEVQSALATRTRPVVAESGAFVVLVEARGDEMVSCQGRTDDGRPVSLEAPPHGFGAR